VDYAESKKDSESLNIRIDSSINHMLARVSAEAGQTKTIVVERALKAYFDDYYDKQEKLCQIEEGLLVPVAEEKKR